MRLRRKAARIPARPAPADCSNGHACSLGLRRPVRRVGAAAMGGACPGPRLPRDVGARPRAGSRSGEATVAVRGRVVGCRRWPRAEHPDGAAADARWLHLARHRGRSGPLRRRPLHDLRPAQHPRPPDPLHSRARRRPRRDPLDRHASGRAGALPRWRLHAVRAGARSAGLWCARPAGGPRRRPLDRPGRGGAGAMGRQPSRSLRSPHGPGARHGSFAVRGPCRRPVGRHRWRRRVPHRQRPHRRRRRDCCARVDGRLDARPGPHGRDVVRHLRRRRLPLPRRTAHALRYLQRLAHRQRLGPARGP